MFSGVERHASFAKSHQVSINEYHIFINHFATRFQRTQMVYEKIMLNIPVL
ncbi:hypothetical protein Hdeb2414_s0010g00341111 [Helianthus debilis subsp. tardiflorus]